jgi:methionine-rich copper-binding protein CopC
LKVYDILGREIAVLVNNYLEAGEYSVYFDVVSVNKEISSGIYFYKLGAADQILTRKMILTK